MSSSRREPEAAPAPQAAIEKGQANGLSGEARVKKIKEIIEKKAMAAIKAALVELIEIIKEQINEYTAEVRATSRWKRAAYGSDYYDVMNDGADGEVEEISAEKWEQSWGGMVDGRERERMARASSRGLHRRQLHVGMSALMTCPPDVRG